MARHKCDVRITPLRTFLRSRLCRERRENDWEVNRGNEAGMALLPHGLHDEKSVQFNQKRRYCQADTGWNADALPQ